VLAWPIPRAVGHSDELAIRVRPTTRMAGFSQTPLWKKLGVRPGDRLLLVGPPPAWSVADLPEDTDSTSETSRARGAEPADVVIAFCGALADVRERVPQLAGRIFPAGALWVAWPRRAAGHVSDIRDQDIRDVALPLGLVDVKVAALDEDWSGLRLV
jgi:hypothetical protein